MTTTRTTYTDPQERVEAALIVASRELEAFHAAVVNRVAAEYRAVNNYVTPGAVRDLMRSVLYDMAEEAATP